MLLTASTSTGTMLALVKDGLVLLALKAKLEVCGTNALDIANMHASTKMTHFIALNSLLELV